MLMEFTYRFEAAHRFLKSQSVPCMTPHGHTWFATMGVSYRGRELDSSQMSVEFSQVKKHWKELIQDTFDHSYLHNINDPVVEVLGNEGNNPRLIPFPGDPTTELISLFMFNKMNKILSASKLNPIVSVEFIKLQETPTNSITCTRVFYEDEIQNIKDYTGWWERLDIGDRSIRGNN